jgi:hypothetical protein
MDEPQKFSLQSACSGAIIKSLQESLPPERESDMKGPTRPPGQQRVLCVARGQNSKITALYSRLSKDDILSNESQSISNQKIDLEGYAKEKGFVNPRHYSDDGHTGVDFDRPAWQEMMSEVEARATSA